MHPGGETAPTSADRAAWRGESRHGVDICVCTYRRPQLATTLQALAVQTGCTDLDIRVIVADNDTTPDAATTIAALGAAHGLDLHYVHAPARNISIARNACLAAAQAEFLAFVDDDVVPSSVWLQELMAEAQRGDWDAVLGPVRAIYPGAVPAWMRDGDFHSARYVKKQDRIVTGYTTSVLLRRDFICRHDLRFDVALGRYGGEDTDFFYRFCDAGGRIGAAATTLAEEPVPIERTRLRYILKRNFRQGQTHARRLRQLSPSGIRRFCQGPIALGKAALLVAGALLHPRQVNRRLYLARAALQCGVAARFAGIGEIELYGN
ncbi:MAG TPA: glycosyltransferase family 2 protein [Stellaceae bacterium]|jgi:succinoglycan biosynthesis protein ExoM|nr:glycosyltransferase family 2 protein [Stellaceae bacterium]